MFKFVFLCSFFLLGVYLAGHAYPSFDNTGVDMTSEEQDVLETKAKSKFSSDSEFLRKTVERYGKRLLESARNGNLGTVRNNLIDMGVILYLSGVVENEDAIMNTRFKEFLEKELINFAETPVSVG